MQSQALMAALSLTLGACASTPMTSPAEFAGRTGHNSFELVRPGVTVADTLLLPVSHDQQEDPIACGAHALASIINYWQGEGTIRGADILAAHPPADAVAGYSMGELLRLAGTYGLIASAVRLPEDAIIAELEAGRPVLVPVRVPAIFVQDWQLPGANVPVLGLPAAVVRSRAAWLSEQTGQNLVDHYVIAAGHEPGSFVVMDPVWGLRTIRTARLARYREAFGNAAIVFSPLPQPPKE
ncbi:hypothetical protein [Hyphomonas sp.]|uniref:hypothetical protein n=1 Tax=Hyphomonas sp. TaxID=87 RepID=UPI003919FDDB